MVDFNNKDKTSEFNSSLDVLTRINGFFHLANHYSFKCLYKDWCNTLLIIFREMSEFIPKEHKGNIENKLLEINAQLIKIKDGPISKEIFFSLHNLDKALRGFFHSSGLGIKAKESDDDWEF